MKFETDQASAVEDVDLVIESIIENEEIKKDFHSQLSKHLPEKTIVTSNSSTMLPSTFAESTGRPEIYLHFYFANTIWHNNIGEVMRHKGTNDESVKAVEAYAKEISMVPVIIEKENPGYVLNALLVPFLDAAEKLYVEGIADFEDIDKIWKISTGSPKGPFEVFDIVGMETPYNLAKAKQGADEEGTTQYKIVKMYEKMIDEGKLGIQTGEGFYKYN